MDILVKKQTICEELGVSLATINNWIKTNAIPGPNINEYYSREIFESIINRLKNDSIRLASRANRSLQEKKEICYLGIKDKERQKLLDNLVSDFQSSNLTNEEGVLALAFMMLRSNDLIGENWQQNSNSKLDMLLSDWIMQSPAQKQTTNFYSDYNIPNYDDDILGAFYQSIQSVSRKSNTGLYYTPPELLSKITVSPNKTILDPCCGSGGILLCVLTKKHDTSRIYARDIDETALKICFINLVLFFNDKNMAADIAKQDISFINSTDLFSNKENKQFDFIVTNPPWGSKYNKQQKDIFLSSYPELATTEIFSISLFNSLKMLKKGGELFFFLPYAFLNVAAHRNIRKYIFNKNNEIDIKLLGNAFKGVSSECILIHIKKNGKQKEIAIEDKKGKVYQLPLNNINPPDYIVSATSNNQETLLMEKIYNTEHITLQNNALFALGIVTGDNHKYLLSNQRDSTEAIFRGKDIEKYNFLSPEYFIEFQPNFYQQVAPVEYYRQKKIVYRFIGDSLICVLDKNNSLILNSANLLISKNYPMETLTALFNSNIYAFIFRKKFHSIKVLKSHLQNLPLPIFSPDLHKYIYNLYNETFNKKDKTISNFQSEIDEIICKYFTIDNTEYDYIMGAI